LKIIAKIHLYEIKAPQLKNQSAEKYQRENFWISSLMCWKYKLAFAFLLKIRPG